MRHAPLHWLAIDAAFSGWSGVCRFHGTKPVEVFRKKGLDFGLWYLAVAGLSGHGEDYRGTPVNLVVIERPYYDKKRSVDSTIKLGRAVGFLDAVAQSVMAGRGGEIVLRLASQWRSKLKVSGSGQAAKDSVRSIVRGFATHPDERARVRGRHDRVYMPGLEGVGLSRKDEDRAEAAGCGIGYAIEQGWPLPTV
jgi:hypothetical protein